MQRAFGGRDTRAPRYFQSVAELNQQIMGGDSDQNNPLPVSSMLPHHVAMRRFPPIVSESASSTTLTISTSDYAGARACGRFYVKGFTVGEHFLFPA